MNAKECISKNQIQNKEKKECSNTMFKVLFFASVALFLGSLVGQLYTTNQLAVKGQEMVDLENQRTELTKQISEMELTRSERASLKYVEEEAYKQFSEYCKG